MPFIMETAISVLMPVYNIGHILDQAEHAIDSLLRQTMPNMQIVIVNDGSTDKKTAEWLQDVSGRDSRIEVYSYPKNKGIAPALNVGLAKCRHELVARHDIDDYSALDRFELQLKYMNENPEYALVGTGMFVVDTMNRLRMSIRKPVGYDNIRNIIKIGCPFAHGSVMFRKSILWDKLGGYDESDEFKYAEDYEFWVRVTSQYPVTNMEELLYMHRDHPTKVSIKYGHQQSLATDRIIAKAKKLIP